MAKCTKCGRFGLNLKLDSFGLCPECQSIFKRDTESRLSNMESELEVLRKFHSQYIVIPDANAEAARITEEAMHESERILAEASANAANIVEEANRESERIISAANTAAEMKMQDAEEIHKEAEKYMASTLQEITEKYRKANAQLAQTKENTSLAIANAEAQIAALLNLAAKDFAAQAKSNAAKTYASSNKTAGKSAASDSAFIPLTPATFKQKAKNGYVVFDLETTGLSRSSDKIIEIGAIKFDCLGQVEDTFSTLVNPGKSIPASASAINHITDGMVANAPKISEVLPDFFRFIDGHPIIAHNVSFDISFLESAVKACKITPPTSIAYGDSLEMARKKYIGLTNYKLGTVAAHLNITEANAHRAVADCEVLGKIVQDILS